MHDTLVSIVLNALIVAGMVMIGGFTGSIGRRGLRWWMYTSAHAAVGIVFAVVGSLSYGQKGWLAVHTFLLWWIAGLNAAISSLQREKQDSARKSANYRGRCTQRTVRSEQDDQIDEDHHPRT